MLECEKRTLRWVRMKIKLIPSLRVAHLYQYLIRKTNMIFSFFYWDSDYQKSNWFLVIINLKLINNNQNVDLLMNNGKQLWLNTKINSNDLPWFFSIEVKSRSTNCRDNHQEFVLVLLLRLWLTFMMIIILHGWLLSCCHQWNNLNCC